MVYYEIKFHGNNNFLIKQLFLIAKGKENIYTNHTVNFPPTTSCRNYFVDNKFSLNDTTVDHMLIISFVFIFIKERNYFMRFINSLYYNKNTLKST